MCISILSTSHPDYPFILLSNRDEFVARPTARADWWDAPNQQVLGGRDLQRKERGTWLGITRQGRIAILTNFREEGDFSIDMSKSRGAIPNCYLCVPPESDESDEDFVKRLMNQIGIHNVGGFTMLFGKLRAPAATTTNGTTNGTSHSLPNGMSNGTHTPSMPGLAIVSNRTSNPSTLRRIATSPGETHGVSNSHFGDMSWPKVVHGEQLLRQAISASISRKDPQSKFIEHLFDILSVDALPKRKREEDWEKFVWHMRNSIMIPPAKGEVTEDHDADELRGGVEGTGPQRVGKEAYGTSKQTVILVDRSGKVTHIERTLYEGEGMPLVEKDRDVRHEFQIEGWHDTS